MLRGWLNTRSQITRETVEAYLNAVMDIDAAYIKRACQLLGGAHIERDNEFPPSAAKLAEVARSLGPAPRRSEPMLPLMAPQISPEERARVAEKFDELVGGLERRNAETERLSVSRSARMRMRERNDALVAQDPRPLEERLRIKHGGTE